MAVGWAAVEDFADCGGLEPVADAHRVQLVADNWLHDQGRWFSRTLRRQGSLLSGLTWTMRVLLGLNIGLVLLVIGSLAMGVAADSCLVKRTLWAAVGCVIVSGSIKAYTAYRGFDEHLNRYANMARFYQEERQALGSLLKASPPNVAQTLQRFEVIARRALDESNSWLALHRSRPLEPPQ
jgi:hypothetical protein